MDRKKLFGEVDYAVELALEARISKLDGMDLEEWTAEDLREDAESVKDTINNTVRSMGWDPEDYHHIVLRMRRNRHTPKGLAI